MNVLLISPQPFFRVRGTPINIRNVVTALAESGHQVDLLCYPFGDDVELPGVRILRSPRFPGINDVKVGPSPAKFPLDGMMAMKAWALARKNRYDVVHAVEEAAFFGATIARRFKAKFVMDMDSLISDQLAYSGFVKFKPLLRFVEWMEKRTIQRSDSVLTVCQALSDAARRLAPEAPICQIEDAPLEVDFVADEVGASALRKEWLPSEARVVVYTGNFESYQGLDLLMQAIPSVCAIASDVHFLLVGGEVRHREALQAKVPKDLRERVHMPGVLPMENMPACLTLASVLVSPRTKGTNTALKVYGYMQAGKPIVATDLPTHTQVLNDSNAYITPCSPEGLADGLLRALSQPVDAMARARQAAKDVDEKYGLDRFYRQVRELYDGLA